MIQQEIVKNKKQDVSSRIEQHVGNFVKELRTELDELNYNNSKFIKYLKSKAEETSINNLEPDWDELFGQPAIPSYTPAIPSDIPSVRPRKQSKLSATASAQPKQQQSWQERIKKDQEMEEQAKQQQSWEERIKKNQEMEKQAKDQELQRLVNKSREITKKMHKEYYGYGIVPPIYPSKMLVNLVKLLTRIYEGYA